MSREKFVRISVICLFLLLDVVLLTLFIQQNFPSSSLAQQSARSLSFLQKTPLSSMLAELPEHETQAPTVTLTAEEILRGFNAERSERKLSALDADQDLQAVAESVLLAIAAQEFDTSVIDSDDLLKEQLAKVDGAEGVLYFDTMVGPRTTDGAFEYWKTSQDHAKTMSIPELSSVGIATMSARLDGELVGAVVSVFLKPQTMTAVPAQPRDVQVVTPTFPEITNQQVLAALNAYRAAHGTAALKEHPALCSYAEKRVQDLVSFGGLDGHEGFRSDFADPDNLPEPIKEYPGGSIGENLAYQNCINMQTNQSFTAPSATALIEWCFDSSTKGHREAQLNPEYRYSCSRNQDGYFVILFGE